MGSGVVFTRVSVIEAPAPDPAGFVIPAIAALVHAYEGTGVVLLLVMLYVFDTLLHQFTVAELVITAVGLTVTMTLAVVPLQLLTLGVIT